MATSKAFQASTTKSSEHMALYTNRSCHTMIFAINGYIWLLEHSLLSIHPTCKLASKLASIYKIIYIIKLQAFCMDILLQK